MMIPPGIAVVIACLMWSLSQAVPTDLVRSTWYISEVNENCDVACANNGGTCSPDTLGLARSGTEMIELTAKLGLSCGAVLSAPHGSLPAYDEKSRACYYARPGGMDRASSLSCADSHVDLRCICPCDIGVISAEGYPSNHLLEPATRKKFERRLSTEITAEYSVRIYQPDGKDLNLAEVQLFSFGVEYAPLSYSLTTEHASFPASNCFDGDFSNFCHSLDGSNVYLGATLSREITQVIVTNRATSQDRIVGGTIIFYRNNASYNSFTFDIAQTTYAFSAAYFRIPEYRIQIYQPSGFLNLAEVQLYSDGVQHTALAYSLSSALSANHASNCFDGNFSSFCHSAVAPGYLDATLSREITEVVVTNRVDCCQDRIVGGTITFYRNDVPYGNYTFDTEQPIYTFSASYFATPEYRIQINQPNVIVINLAEVQLYSDGIQYAPLVYSLSSHHPTYPASKCFDGDYNSFCHSYTPRDYLDATLSQEITQVVVTNRIGCCEDRIIGATITFYRNDVPYGSFTFDSAQASYTFTAEVTSAPSSLPSSQPSSLPTSGPSSLPSSQPSSLPTSGPSSLPSSQPSSLPTSGPSLFPTCQPSSLPTAGPSSQPSSLPTSGPSSQPSAQPSLLPKSEPSSPPSAQPSLLPTSEPSMEQTSEQPSTFLQEPAKVCFTTSHHIKALCADHSEESITSRFDENLCLVKVNSTETCIVPPLTCGNV